MGRVIVQKHTTLNPIQLIGEEAGYCWGADTTDEIKNYKRGLSCISSGHFRTTEFPQVYLVLEGYSARVIRELYTHIGGSPTRLQASTRYIDYGNENFDYIIPHSIEDNEDLKEIYTQSVVSTQKDLMSLRELGAEKEDVANLLPLGMTTTIVLRTNARNLMDMSHQRECRRVYWEFRELFQDIKKALSEYSEEWEEFIKMTFKPKCEILGYCTEEKSCKRKPRKETIDEFILVAKELLKKDKELYLQLKSSI